MGWAHSASKAMALLGKAAHRGNGTVICCDVDCLLRGQWEAVAALEGLAPRHVLAIALGSRNTSHGSSAPVASALARIWSALRKVSMIKCSTAGVRADIPDRQLPATFRH